IAQRRYVASILRVDQYKHKTTESVSHNALDSERRVIETTESIVCDRQDWQLHRHSQVTDEIIRTNRYHPAACPFDDDVFNPILKSMKSSEDIFDMDIRFLYQSAHDRRRRRF